MVHDVITSFQDALVVHLPQNYPSGPPTPAENITTSTQVSKTIKYSNTTQQQMLQNMKKMIHTMKMQLAQGGGWGGVVSGGYDGNGNG